MGGKKKKREETTSSKSKPTSLRSSSGRSFAAGLQSQPQQQQVKVASVGCGCMAGIFHLVSKYHTRRKFLTFGKKQVRQAISTATKRETVTTITCLPHGEHVSPETSAAGRTSLEVPRSPVIPAEIRSSASVNSPRVVARLMGIENLPPSSPVVVESAAEKRRKLLGALEKCDEDLKALKKIIDSVRASSQTPPRKAVDGGGREGERREKRVEEEADKEREEQEEEPSPVSVLDFHHRQELLLLLSPSPPLTSYSKSPPHGQELDQQQNQQKPKGARKLKPEEEHSSSFYFLNRSITSSNTSVVHISSTAVTPDFFPAKTRPPPITAPRTTAASAVPWSKAVVDSVEEVCRSFESGQKFEVERLGLLIQDFIFKDLVDEVVKEMTLMMMIKKNILCYKFNHAFSSSSRIIRLPYEACKRKLSF